MKKKLLMFISILIFSLTSCDIIKAGVSQSTNSSVDGTNASPNEVVLTNQMVKKELDEIMEMDKLTVIEETHIIHKDDSTDYAKRISNIDTNKNYMSSTIAHGDDEGYVYLAANSYFYRLGNKSQRLDYTPTGDAFESIGISALNEIADFSIENNVASAIAFGSTAYEFENAYKNVALDIEADSDYNPSILKINIEFNKSGIEKINLDMDLIYGSYYKSVLRTISFSYDEFEYINRDFTSGTKYYANTAETLDTYVIEMIEMYADSIFIESGDFDMLIDAGQPEDGPNVKEMLDKHVLDNKLELLIVTHGHGDHLGGINAGALDGLEIGMIIDYGYQGNDPYYENLRQTFGGDYFTAYDCVNMTNGAYKIFNFGANLSVEILDTGQYTPFGVEPPKNENDPSVTCKLTFGKNTYLYTGDLSGDYEGSLRKENIKDITVYKAAHHGSTSHGSNTQSFLNYINPEICVVSAAIVDSYEINTSTQWHPSVGFVRRILQAPKISKNKNLYYNGTMGTIHLIDDGVNIPTVRGLGAKKGYYSDNGSLVTGEENKKFIDTEFYKYMEF